VTVERHRTQRTIQIASDRVLPLAIVRLWSG